MEKIFRVLFPEQGLAVREEQIRLCHEMLDTLLGEQIALCDAGVGIGKTYAYLVACVLLRKYSMLTGRGNPLEQRPVVVFFHIALQKAILTEVYSIFIQSAVGAGDHSVTSSGSGAEREGTLCLRQQAGTTIEAIAINRRMCRKRSVAVSTKTV